MESYERSSAVRALAFSLFLGGCTLNAQAPVRTFLDTYCITCHNQKLHTAGLALDSVDAAQPSGQAEVWERVIAKLRAGSMPPPGSAAGGCGHLSRDRELRSKMTSIKHGRPSRIRDESARSIGSIARNTTTRFATFSRSIFDVKPLLPGDETADGSFDNFADVALDFYGASGAVHVGGAAGDAAGDGSASERSPGMDRFEIPLHVLQDDRQSEDLPLGSRGGIAIHYDFPVDGEYLIQRPPAEAVSGLPQGHGMAAAARCSAGWQAAEAVHGGRRGQRPAGGGQLCGRRRARFCGRS